MEEIANIILNTGVSVVVIAYFIYRDYKFMGTLQSTLQALIDTVDSLKDSIKDKASIKEKEGN